MTFIKQIFFTNYIRGLVTLILLFGAISDFWLFGVVDVIARISVFLIVPFIFLVSIFIVTFPNMIFAADKEGKLRDIMFKAMTAQKGQERAMVLIDAVIFGILLACSFKFLFVLYFLHAVVGRCFGAKSVEQYKAFVMKQEGAREDAEFGVENR